MRAAGRTGNEECPVQMKLVAPPLYVLTTQTLDKAKGIQVLNEAIEQAEESIKSHKGSFKVKEAPRTVSERDDFLLQSKVSSHDCKPGCKKYTTSCHEGLLQASRCALLFNMILVCTALVSLSCHLVLQQCSR